jgi:xanthine dehydrogenase small subunit
MPALISIGARVKLRKDMETRELEMQELYLDYQKNAMEAGEFVESVIISKRDESMQIRCYKLCKRFDQDISAVCAAFALRLKDGRVDSITIAFGGMAAIPKRATQTEKLLLGKTWDEKIVSEAMDTLKQDFSPLSDMRASAGYRQQAGSNLLYRFYLETRPQGALKPAAVNVFALEA